METIRICPPGSDLSTGAAAGSLSACADKGQPTNGSGGSKTAADGTMTICKECEGLPPLGMVGPSAPAVGDYYSASGGKAPYKYTMSAGTVDAETGEVKSLSGACGTGTVSVEDACKNKASISVKFPTGQWVDGPFNGCGGYTTPCVGSHPYRQRISCVTYSDTTRTTKYYEAVRSFNPYGWCSGIEANPCYIGTPSTLCDGTKPVTGDSCGVLYCGSFTATWECL